MMIKLSKYMNPLDVDSIVRLDTEFTINGNKYKLYRNSGSDTYALLTGVIIIGMINPKGVSLTFRDIYEYLSISIPEKSTLSIGDILYNHSLNEYTIISKVDSNSFNITGLDDGNRWSVAHTTRDIYAITYDEFSDMVGDIDRFSYVGKFNDVFMVR